MLRDQKAPGAEKDRRGDLLPSTVHGVVAEADGGWRIFESSSARAACSRYCPVCWIVVRVEDALIRGSGLRILFFNCEVLTQGKPIGCGGFHGLSSSGRIPVPPALCLVMKRASGPSVPSRWPSLRSVRSLEWRIQRDWLSDGYRRLRNVL